MQQLDAEPGVALLPVDISRDGAIVAGNRGGGGGVRLVVATHTVQSLVALGAYAETEAVVMTGDGTRISGTARNGPNFAAGVLWDDLGDVVNTVLPDTSRTYDRRTASHISDNGRFAFVNVDMANPSFTARYLQVWYLEGDPVTPHCLESTSSRMIGYFVTNNFAATDDRTTCFGATLNSFNQVVSYRECRQTNAVVQPYPVTDASADGALRASGQFVQLSPTGPWLNLKSYLLTQGASDVAAWPTLNITDVSPNARYLAGVGVNLQNEQSAFLVDLGPTCDPLDFNHDALFPDTQDIDDFLSVFAGGPCSTGTCGDIDFNNDGLFPDTADIDSLLSAFAGNPCV